MPLVVWEESLSIGVADIDAQHRHLIEMVNIVAGAVELNDGQDLAGAALRSLCDYAVEHFAAEEALMDMDTYPEYDLHVSEHMDCTDKALDFLQAYSEDGGVDMAEFLKFLAGWVRTHIMEMDQSLGRHLKARAAAASGPRQDAG